MDRDSIIAVWIAYMSVMMLLRYPGGGVAANIANNYKTDLGHWVFIVADISAFFISMALLIVEMTVGPTSWEKNNKRVRIARITAIVAMMVAARHTFLVRLDELWLRLLVHGSSIVFMSFVCFAIYILWSEGNSRKNQVEAGPVGKRSTQ